MFTRSLLGLAFLASGCRQVFSLDEPAPESDGGPSNWACGELPDAPPDIHIVQGDDSFDVANTSIDDQGKRATITGDSATFTMNLSGRFFCSAGTMCPFEIEYGTPTTKLGCITSGIVSGTTGSLGTFTTIGSGTMKFPITGQIELRVGFVEQAPCDDNYTSGPPDDHHVAAYVCIH